MPKNEQNGITLKITGGIIAGVIVSIASGLMANAWANGRRDTKIEELERRVNYIEPKVDDILKKVSYLYEKAKEGKP